MKICFAEGIEEIRCSTHTKNGSSESTEFENQEKIFYAFTQLTSELKNSQHYAFKTRHVKQLLGTILSCAKNDIIKVTKSEHDRGLNYINIHK
jgi:hypothetical protein